MSNPTGLFADITEKIMAKIRVHLLPNDDKEHHYNRVFEAVLHTLEDSLEEKS